MNGFQTVLAQNWTHVTYEPNNDSAQRFLFHLEHFFIDYRKTKTKVITKADHMKGKSLKSQ